MGAAPGFYEIRVAGAYPDGGKRYAKPIGDDLREGGFMALAGGLRADHEFDAAVSQDGEIGALAWNAAGPLDVVCNRDAGELAARFGGFAPCRKAGPVGEFK